MFWIKLIQIFLGIVILVFISWFYWRYFWFFRDPKRVSPQGNNIVSPADGTIVYAKKVKKNQIPISNKRGKFIDLSKDVKEHLTGEKYLVGIFMTPFNVHVQRAPIAGTIKKIKHYKHENLVMTLMWLRIFLNLRPFYSHCNHMWVNERQITLIKGVVPVYVVQIADLVVNKVVSFVKPRQTVKKGDRIGLIKMGSQVDLVFPTTAVELVVKEGDKVKAGESIIATIKK